MSVKVLASDILQEPFTYTTTHTELAGYDLSKCIDNSGISYLDLSGIADPTFTITTSLKTINGIGIYGHNNLGSISIRTDIGTDPRDFFTFTAPTDGSAACFIHVPKPVSIVEIKFNGTELNRTLSVLKIGSWLDFPIVGSFQPAYYQATEYEMKRNNKAEHSNSNIRNVPVKLKLKIPTKTKFPNFTSATLNNSQPTNIQNVDGANQGFASSFGKIFARKSFFLRYTKNFTEPVNYLTNHATITQNTIKSSVNNGTAVFSTEQTFIGQGSIKHTATAHDSYFSFATSFTADFPQRIIPNRNYVVSCYVYLASELTNYSASTNLDLYFRSDDLSAQIVNIPNTINLVKDEWVRVYGTITRNANFPGANSSSPKMNLRIDNDSFNQKVSGSETVMYYDGFQIEIDSGSGLPTAWQPSSLDQSENKTYYCHGVKASSTPQYTSPTNIDWSITVDGYVK